MQVSSSSIGDDLTLWSAVRASMKDRETHTHTERLIVPSEQRVTVGEGSWHLLYAWDPRPVALCVFLYLYIYLCEDQYRIENLGVRTLAGSEDSLVARHFLTHFTRCVEGVRPGFRIKV